MAIAKHYPLPEFMRAGHNRFFYDAITEIYDMLGVQTQGESGMQLTGFSPRYVDGGTQHVLTGTGFTETWAPGEEYMVAFAPTGSTDPSGWRSFSGGWTETELTTGFLSQSQVESDSTPGVYDCFLIRSDDQGDPIQPFVVMSNVLVGAVEIPNPPQ